MTKEGWKKAIAEQARSGKSIAEFCRERGLNPKTFSVSKWQMKKGAFVQVSGSRTVELVGVRPPTGRYPACSSL